MEFKCSSCGGHSLEEVMRDVLVVSECKIVEGIVEYGEQTNEGGEIDRYQCSHCGLWVYDANGVLIRDEDVMIQAFEAGDYICKHPRPEDIT